MNEELTYHVPVLLKPSVDGMNIRPDGTYVDVTFGGGGHSREILSRLGDGGRLLGFDQDEDAEQNIVDNPHFIFVRSNFRYLHNFLRYHNIEEVDAILADLGVSSHHFDDSERGFSFRFDGALDMRMNKRAGDTAADIINTYDEERLADIFYLYGELKNSRKLASVLVKARAGQKITTIGEFLEVIKPLFGREREKKELAKVFQALRIDPRSGSRSCGPRRGRGGCSGCPGRRPASRPDSRPQRRLHRRKGRRTAGCRPASALPAHRCRCRRRERHLRHAVRESPPVRRGPDHSSG